MRLYHHQDQVAGFGFSAGPDDVFPVAEAGEAWMPEGWQLGWHSNPGWELFFQAAGSTRWQVGRRTFVVPESGCYLIPPGMRHRLVGSTDAAIHFYYVVFGSAVVADLAPGFPTGSPVFHREQAYALRLPFAGLIRSISLAGSQRETTVEAYARCLAATVVEIGEQLPADRTNIGHPGALHARDLIEDNLSHPWRLDELARLSGVSKPHLIELFRRAFGDTPQQYRLKARLREAARALHESDESITAIAMRLGFSSSQHLSTSFRKAYEQSPREYRAGRSV